MKVKETKEATDAQVKDAAGKNSNKLTETVQHARGVKTTTMKTKREEMSV